MAYDPEAIPNARKVLAKDVEFVEDPCSAIKGADCTIIMADFRELNFTGFGLGPRN